MIWTSDHAIMYVNNSTLYEIIEYTVWENSLCYWNVDICMFITVLVYMWEQSWKYRHVCRGQSSVFFVWYIEKQFSDMITQSCGQVYCERRTNAKLFSFTEINTYIWILSELLFVIELMNRFLFCLLASYIYMHVILIYKITQKILKVFLFFN